MFDVEHPFFVPYFCILFSNVHMLFVGNRRRFLDFLIKSVELVFVSCKKSELLLKRRRLGFIEELTEGVLL